jgi:hypothetical protein
MADSEESDASESKEPFAQPRDAEGMPGFVA